MSRNARFWQGLRITLLVLIGVSICAAMVCYFSLDGLRRTFFSLCCLIMAANFGFMYGFVRINDRKRPIRRSDETDHTVSRDVDD